MRRRTQRILRFLLLLLPAACFGQQALNPLPKLVVHAKYVLVTTYQGYDLSNPNVLPDDRQAVLAVQDAIKKWGRYELAYRPQDADLIFLVRKGRIMEAQPQLRVGGGSNMPVNVGANTPVDVGDKRDMLAMFTAEEGVDGTALWRNFESGGLEPPQMALMQELRKAVEKTAKLP